MTLPSPSQDLTLSIYLSLAQYPILSTHIRARMRQELFQRGIITNQAFETEAREKAIHSQELEGINQPLVEEPYEVWETRLSFIRDHLTDFYFAYNLPYELFEQIVRQVLAERGAADEEQIISFNPELAPQSMLLEQGRAIERMPAEERPRYEARLHEIKAVLIRTLISDQLGYVQIASQWFTIDDLRNIRKRKIGSGKIGGKSAGMLLAKRILDEVGDVELTRCLHIPESYFIGADLTYDFMTVNCLTPWLDQKYKSDEQIRAEFPELQADFLNAELPPDIQDQLRKILLEIGNQPVIVRSSSLLEDNFGTSFAGKYESHFCPNQGTLQQNLQDICTAITRVYASIFNPDALFYRRAKGLQDYDERMAILIQVVQGQKFGDYFLPHVSGVGYSRNIYRWSPQIRPEDGFLRVVWGLGTRAVERTGDDYARLVALSHPTLHPEASALVTRSYSQQFVDLIHLRENIFTTLPVTEVIDSDYPALRYLTQLDAGGYFVPIRSLDSELTPDRLVLTFDELFRRTDAAKKMTRALQILEKHYHSPVDTEFTFEIQKLDEIQPEVHISILQCRPQSGLKERKVALPVNLKEEDVIFSTPRMVPEGFVDDVRYVVFVTPEGYFHLPSSNARALLTQAIAKLNEALADENFICVGPGRWGTSTPDLGIHVGYGDIYHTRALVEITGSLIGPLSEASYGTHFFQDLIESQIYPLAVVLDDEQAIFNRRFFYDTPNEIANFLKKDFPVPDCLRLIQVGSYRKGQHIEIVMDHVKGTAVAYLAKD